MGDDPARLAAFDKELAEARLKLATAEVKRLRNLVRHCWVHSAYRDCGFMEMDTPMKALYCKVIGRPASEREDR